MGCFFNKPSKEPINEQNSNRKLSQRNILHTSIVDKNSINKASHTPLSMISCIDIKKHYEVSTSESSVSSISIMDLVLNLDSLKIETSITKTHKIEHYHDIIPFIEPQLKKKKIGNMDKSKKNIVTMPYKKNNIKQPDFGFKLCTNSVDYEKKILVQKKLINNIFYYEYIKQQEIDNLFRNDNCLLNTQHRNNISRFS
jgi:hypothetical protein